MWIRWLLEKVNVWYYQIFKYSSFTYFDITLKINPSFLCVFSILDFCILLYFIHDLIMNLQLEQDVERLVKGLYMKVHQKINDRKFFRKAHIDVMWNNFQEYKKRMIPSSIRYMWCNCLELIWMVRHHQYKCGWCGNTKENIIYIKQK